MPDQLRYIDVHSHIISENWFEGIKKDFPKITPIFDLKPSGLLDILPATGAGKLAASLPDTVANPKKRLADLEKRNIGVQVLACLVNLMFYDLPAELSLRMNAIQNDGIAELVHDHPDKFAGVCSVPLCDVQLAIGELERSVKKLGMKGVQIGSNVNGKDLDDETLFPFYKIVEELGVPIIVHPSNVASANRLNKYFLHNLIGNPLDSTIAASRLLFTGVFQRFANLDFIFLHGGGYLPYQLGRLEQGYQVIKETRANITRPPSDYLQKLYFDTILHYLPALEFMVKTHGASRVVLGTDYPFPMGDLDPVHTLNDLKIGGQEKQLIAFENATRLFKLKLS